MRKESHWRSFGTLLILMTILMSLLMSQTMIVYENTVLQWSYFLLVVLTQSFLMVFLANALLTLLPWLFLSHRLAKDCWTTLVNGLLLSIIVTDVLVYQQYRFHLTWAMVDLVLNTDGQIVSFSLEMVSQVLVWLLGIFVLSGLVVYVAGSNTIKGVSGKAILGLFLSLFLLANGLNIYATAKSNVEVLQINQRVPLWKPIRANTHLKKVGLIDESDRVVFTDISAQLQYPKNPLTFDEKAPLKNVVMIEIDALRADMLNGNEMPYTWSLAQKGWLFEKHFSSGNATRAGVFGLFYGIPPMYWKATLDSHTPSALITAMQKRGYELGVFSSATLSKPEFSETIFAGVPSLRMGSKAKTAIDRDKEVINDFSQWSKNLNNKAPFFSWLFLDSVHGSAFPQDGQKAPYEPYWKEVNFMKLGPNFDPIPYFNRYKNTVRWADQMVSQVMGVLQQNNQLDNTVIIITADHGEEFNDNRKNYWGHNANFTPTQVQIPLIILYPGEKQGKQFKHMTTAYDLNAFLMQKVLHCQNDIQDYSVGHDLLDTTIVDKHFIAGSYLEDAIISEKGVLLIDKFGIPTSFDHAWNTLQDDTMKSYLPEYFQTRKAYLK